MPETEISQIEKYTKEYYNYLNNLFVRAQNTDSFEFLCTLLRVKGITNGHWDPFVEAEEAANDISELMKNSEKNTETKRRIRLGLFLYCHLTEISAMYELLANVLGIIQGKKYRIQPFSHLVKIIGKKEDLFAKRKLPSPAAKINDLTTTASTVGEQKLSEIINGYFRSNIRNAFYHSDYTISEEDFRIIEGSQFGAEVFSLNEISLILTKCFAFYSAFFATYKNAKKSFAGIKRYHRWPNYEVLEILKDEKNELLGFKVHLPNASTAMYTREDYKGTSGYNVMSTQDGVTIMVGDLDAYYKGNDWIVDGKSFIEYGTRYNPYGYWRPIIFQRDADLIQRQASISTSNKDAQGIMFYILATGHLCLEFVIKAKEKMFDGESFIIKQGDKKYIEIFACKDYENLYDASIFLENKNIETTEKALNDMNGLMGHKDFIGKISLIWQKYTLYHRPKKPELDEDGLLSMTFKMDNPTSTLVASSLGMFPKQDWKIKPEWLD